MKYLKERIDYKSPIMERETYYLIYQPENAQTDSLPLIIWLHGWGGAPHCDIFIKTIELFSDTVSVPPIVLAPYGMEGKECSEWINRYDGSLSLESHIV